jgi:hypothetical protein
MQKFNWTVLALTLCQCEVWSGVADEIFEQGQDQGQMASTSEWQRQLHFETILMHFHT